MNTIRSYKALVIVSNVDQGEMIKKCNKKINTLIETLAREKISIFFYIFIYIMGNKQSIPKEISDRIKDLKQRIQEGKFSNNDKGIEDIKNLLGYWDNKYGIAGQKVEDGKVLLENHFNCETIVEKKFCNKRGDSKCRWDPIDRFEDGSEDKKNFDLHKGICKYADGVTEHDYQRQRNKYNAAKKKGEIFVQINGENNIVLFKNVGTGETFLKIPPGGRLATSVDMQNLERRAQGMVDEANSIPKDREQPSTGNASKKRGGKSRRRKVPLSIIFGTKLSKSTKLKKWRAMKKHQKTKKRKKTRLKRKRTTKRRKR